MAFKLDKSPSYRWPVTFTQVSQDGTLVDSVLNFDFARFSQTEIEEISRRYGLEENDPERQTDKQTIDRVVLGWDGYLDDDDKPVPFSKDALEEFLNSRPGFRFALVMGWFASLKVGQGKNLQTQPVPG